MRIDSNDYSVHPAVIGRPIELIVNLHRVKAFCDGRLVADHERVWAWHQTISDPEHLAAAKLLRRERVGCCDRSSRPAPTSRSRNRSLADYNAAIGLDVDGGVA